MPIRGSVMREGALLSAIPVPSSAIRLFAITGGCLVLILQMQVMGSGFFLS